MDKASTSRQDAKILANQNSAEYVASDEGEDSGARPSVFASFLGFLTNPYFTLISRLVLGGILLLAGLTKLSDINGLKDSIDAYDMGIPMLVRNIMATGLPPLELGLGVWLIAGLFTRFAAAISGGLMVIFLIAITQATLRGLNIDCGCFATAAPHAKSLGDTVLQALGPVGDFLGHEKADAVTIVRDLIFLLMSVHLMFVPTVFGLDSLRKRDQGPGDWDQEYDEPLEEASE